MGRAFSDTDLKVPDGRRAAWRALMLGDHGALRLFYDNTHTIDPGRLWRTYQPSPDHLKRWHERHQIRTVINLRGETPAGHFILEREACARLGMTLVNFKVYSREAPTPKIIHDAAKLFASITYPAIMHCKSGADRAGMMAVLYSFFEMGMPLDKAMAHLSWRYGHVRQGKTGVIDHAFDLYVTHARARGTALDDKDAFLRWIDDGYDPVAIKAAFLSTWWGRLLTDRILNRE
ncbi:MAG: protein tyrosine phosphatase [Pseudomonadota bacterium]